uniref:BLOC-1-related complex subunit 7 n=1 Tax=Myxine glutinosa TaxID=7769 RepID=UPI00358FC15D
MAAPASHRRSMLSERPTSGASSRVVLADRLSSCTTDVAALARVVLRASRSAELLGQASQNMAAQEDALQHCEEHMEKMLIMTTHLQYQQGAIEKNVCLIEEVMEQLRHLVK